MKKIILTIALAVSMFSFAQEKSKEMPKITVSANFNNSDAGYYSISFEIQAEKNKSESKIGNLGFGVMDVTVGEVKHSTTGFNLESGKRFYFTKNANEKFYYENLLQYAKFKFSDAGYSGVYEYFSFINPNMGYKFLIGKHFTIDPSVGFNWKVEIMSRGDVDNRTFDNFIAKGGIKLGYRF